MFVRDQRIGSYTYVYLVENVRENVNRRPKGPPDRRAKRTPCDNCHDRRGWTAGGRVAPDVAQRPTDVRCTGA